jgi:PKD domain
VVTVSDLVGFDPPVATAHMEPNGWAVVGLPANFYATVEGPRVQTGSLLGQPASVRFAVAGFTWDYGDGASADVRVAGAPWEESSLPEFSATETSHEYESAGDYRVSLTAYYAAEYRYGGDAWLPVTGVLAVDSGVLPVSAGAAQTVLVERECTQNPSGPGC